MVDYEKKYHEYTQGILKCIPDISNDYPECNGLEKCVISMRKQGWSYAEIQSKLGMPPKKKIREILLKWAPELIDNSIQKIIKVSNYEATLYNIVVKHKQNKFIIEGDEWEFFIKDKTLKYIDWSGDEDLFSNLDIATQSQILNEIKNQLNES